MSFHWTSICEVERTVSVSPVGADGFPPSSHVFVAGSHEVPVGHDPPAPHTGWHLPSALHLEPPGHSPLGPHVISVQEAVQ